MTVHGDNAQIDIYFRTYEWLINHNFCIIVIYFRFVVTIRLLILHDARGNLVQM